MNNQQNMATAPVITLTASKTANTLGVLSFICGLVGLLSSVFGFVPGFLGYAFYLDAKRRGCTSGLMTAGKVMSIISIIISALCCALIVACYGCAIASLASGSLDA